MRTRIICCLLFVFLYGCATVPKGNFPEISPDNGRLLTLWLLSDIQPPTVHQRKVFERAVADVKENTGEIDVGIIAGDLLTSRSNREDFEWFIETRNRTEVTDWFQIAGNHDIRSGDIFYEFFPESDHFAVELGNLLLLFMSDQSTASRTDISDEVFFWWKEMVEANQDRIIITITHAQLAGSGLLSSGISSRVIHNSRRFEKVLEQNRVAMWLSGHSHLPQSLSGTVKRVEKFSTTYFVNVSSISDESFLDSESRFLYLQDGSDVIWMRSRNHSKKSFTSGLDFPIQLEKPFRWYGERPTVL